MSVEGSLVWSPIMRLCLSEDIPHILGENRGKLEHQKKLQGGINTAEYGMAKNMGERVASQHSHSPGRFK